MEKDKQTVFTFFLDDDVVDGLDALCPPGRSREELIVEILTRAVREKEGLREDPAPCAPISAPGNTAPG